jgi:Protein of unknown function (DUF1553)/Protein of unknown function (DUF1549)/Planctomycete cytochrome C
LVCASLWVLFGAKADAEKSSPSDSNPQNNGKVDFGRDVLPILEASCKGCHSGEEAQGGLDLTSEARVFAGGNSGRLFVPGRSSESLLIQRLVGQSGKSRMPLGGIALTDDKIQTIRAWIDEGAQHSRSFTLDFSAIAPILSEHCVQCHGPGTQQNGLRLDSGEAVLKGSANGKIVVTGKSEASPLVRRLLGDIKPQMPYGNQPLAESEIALIREWIDAGALNSHSAANSPPKVHKHWAYIKPERPPLPEVKDQAWVRNPIDAFVLARLEKEGLSPSPEASKETLIRRLNLDLIGLPPSPQEVDAFVADKNPDAYERLVDRLLASPHYGERWARPWLDLARYADTNGYEKDDRRTAWKYRDWVINALNQDMSFKEFTIEQIAGDMLPNPTKDQLIATGFERNSMLNQEGGIDVEEYRYYSLVDRVNTTAAVWLGTTLGCAQCHNHKFDPFTQKDYYRFLAFFDNGVYSVVDHGDRYVREPQIELPTPDQAAKAKVLRADIARYTETLDTSSPELDAAQAKWEVRQKQIDGDWVVLKPEQVSSLGGAALTVQPDLSILAGGKNPQADTYEITSQTNRTGIAAFRMEVLRDPSLPNGGPGRDPDGNFFLSDVDVEAAPADRPAAFQPVEFKSAAADESQDDYNAEKILLKDMNLHGWAVDTTDSPAPPRRQIVFVAAMPFGFPQGTILKIRMKHEMRHSSRNIGRFRLSITTVNDPLEAVRLEAHLRPLLDVPPDKRTDEQKQALAANFRAVTPLLDPVRKEKTETEDKLNGLGIATAMVMSERPGYGRPTSVIRIRGTFTMPGDRVYAGVPSVLNPLPPDVMPNRLGLAEWLVDDNNPLTGRVQVNHYWETLFGRGIVETGEDFGTQGDPPSHPELLDWLAVEFMSKGWSMKNILREIVTSATYRQSSHVTPELLERDPYNKLLARGPRFRMEAEMVGDAALSASGLLNPEIGGPSVFPFQPEGVWNMPYNDDRWVMSKNGDQYRRDIYTFIRRTSPYPSLVTFDAPTREFCTVRRVRTNTPLQALTTLNDEVFFEAARAMAQRMQKEGGSTPADQVAYGFRLCTSRRPEKAELDELMGFYRRELDNFQKDDKAATEVVQSKDAADAPRWAAMTMVANVILNLDEAITIE